MSEVSLHLGDCLDVLPTIASESIDAVITDPPYPEIKRAYGRWTVEEWWALIVKGVIPEVRRILKPTGSAVFILQPNSEKVGKMRGWLWEFMAWVCREWNMVQDVWWWNTSAQPNVHTQRQNGLMRPSIKPCIWCGDQGCYRDQQAILWSESERNIQRRAEERAAREYRPSGWSMDTHKCTHAALERGGVTPFNLLPLPNTNSQSSSGAHGHGAGTPLKLADWWTRYICPPGGTVCDPFMGSGTMGLAALQNGCGFIGVEKMPGQGYFATAQQRIEQARREGRQLGLELVT
jgi:site-specific DNA-methyltransferase (cytosine-N4-specific)